MIENPLLILAAALGFAMMAYGLLRDRRRPAAVRRGSALLGFFPLFGAALAALSLLFHFRVLTLPH